MNPSQHPGEKSLQIVSDTASQPWGGALHPPLLHQSTSTLVPKPASKDSWHIVWPLLGTTVTRK